MTIPTDADISASVVNVSIGTAAEFRAKNKPLPHVAETPENAESATCGKPPATLTDSTRLSAKELANWAMANFTVDPVKNSKNRWKIRIRCRKVGCDHSTHLNILTVSFMSDAAFGQASRGSKKYEQWKKQILAENARALRKGY